MQLTGIRGVIFDMGSTLIEFENKTWYDLRLEGNRLGYEKLIAAGHELPDFDTFHAGAEEAKVSFRERAFKEGIEWNITTATQKYLEQIGIVEAEALSHQFIVDFFVAVRDQLTLIDGALETVRAIAGAGLKTGMISNTIFPGDEHEIDIKRFGLDAYLPFRIYSSSYGLRKPRPEIFLEGAKQIGLPPEEIVYVGDRHLEDVEGPHSAGMKAVLKFHKGRDYPDPMPNDFPIIEDITGLLKVLGIEQPTR